MQRALLLLLNFRPKYKLELGVAELGVLGFAMWVMLQQIKGNRNRQPGDIMFKHP